MKTQLATIIRTITGFIKAHTVASATVASIVAVTAVGVPIVLNLESPPPYALELDSSYIQASSEATATSTVSEASSEVANSSEPSESSSAPSPTTKPATSYKASSTPAVQTIVAPKTGDIVYDGDYQYIYNYTPDGEGGVDFDNPYNNWYKNPEQKGWGVRCVVGPATTTIDASGFKENGLHFNGASSGFPAGGLAKYGTIKSYIQGEPVVCADYLFNGCTNMTSSPALPDTITSLFETYNGCTGLTTAPTLPKGVTNLNRTFASCTALKTAPKIPSTVTQMDSTFAYCKNLISAPAIPNGVTTLSMCFKECASLTTAPTIPASVKGLSETFAYCTNLTGTITINSTIVEYLANTYCFEGTEKAIVLTGSASKDILDALAQSTFSGNITVSK